MCEDEGRAISLDRLSNVHSSTSQKDTRKLRNPTLFFLHRTSRRPFASPSPFTKFAARNKKKRLETVNLVRDRSHTSVHALAESPIRATALRRGLCGTKYVGCSCRARLGESCA